MLWPLAATAALALAMLAAVLIATDGTLVYTLDDPYIHLAFSEQIARGHFGLVAAETASPSSSILWPLLLTPFAGGALHPYVPLILNIAALLAAVALWQRTLRNFVLAGLPGRDARAMAGVLAVLLPLFTNQLGLAFSGMEHGLQTTLTLCLIAGLIELLESGRLRWWLLAGIALGPLVRYENVGFSLVGLALLARLGHWRWSLALAAAIAAAFAAFAAVSIGAGLPPFSGSVAIKTGANTHGPYALVVQHAMSVLRLILRGAFDVGLLLPIALIAVRPLLPDPPARRGETLMTLGTAAALAAQLVYGGHYNLGRYDLYAVAGGAMALLWFYRAPFAGLLARMSVARLALLTAALGATALSAMGLRLLATPLAAQDIYRQHWQMARFLTEQVKAPVAVNDVGLTAYRNPYGVLDLVGLGSEEVRRLRREGRFNPATFAALLRARGIDTLLVYDSWVRDALPEAAVPVAYFHLGRRHVSAAVEIVTLMALTPQAAVRLRAQALAFAPSMPRGARLEVLPPP